jgi:LPS export ABC transporter permease LptF/LPS export ABC transporter permease LptG
VRILTRYIWKEVFSHAIIGWALFTFILYMKYIGELLEMAVRNSSSIGGVIGIFILDLPNFFIVTIPMAVLVGVLLGLSRLAADSEITAMRAAGIGVWAFVRVLSAVAILSCLISLANSLYVAPKATAALLGLQNSLKNQQASFEVQPQVFYEDFKNYVLYVQDVRASVGASQWQRVFLADVSDPANPKVSTAAQATVVNQPNQTVLMRMRDGTEHELVNTSGEEQYQVSTFAESDLPLAFGVQDDQRIGHSDTPILAMNNRELFNKARSPGGSGYMIEMQKRFAYPVACLVLTLVGIPLGISSRRGGKSAGFVLTIALVFIYYFLSYTGVALARQGKIPVFAGVWAANFIFAFFGLLLLRQMASGGRIAAQLASLTGWLKRPQPASARTKPAAKSKTAERHGRGRFPLILDDYVLREFLTTFVLVLVSFVMLFLVFTLFELLGDIIRNQTPLVTVGEYLINLTPSMVYLITPLAVLVAVLVTFGVLTRTNELTAMKATGISIYRVIVPVLLIAGVLAVALFLFDQSYLPGANRRQEALRSIIKGKPAQTFLRPGQQWIFGLQQPGKPGRIFYYQFFDSDHDRFANIWVYEFDPENFHISRSIYASSAHWEPQLNEWIFEQGWDRSFSGETLSSYSPFRVASFPEIVERPQYFKTEVLQSQEMSFGELRRYIAGLRQSGFDTKRLSVQLNKKLAFPTITLVMAILAVPFALSMGKRGSLTGIAAAIGLAVAYWAIEGTFEAFGNVNLLPALLAAWSPDLLFALLGGYLLLRTST